MNELTVTSQAELDAVPVDYNGRILIKFGTPYNRAVVKRRYKYPVEAWGNSSVVARDSCSVVAWDSCSVEARDSCSVEAWENSSVEAWGNCSVEARDSCSVVAWGNCSVEARDSCSVVARDSCSVVAWGNCSVVARDSCSVVAWGNCSVEARDSGSVEAWGNSSVEARDSCSVVARDSCSVVARGNCSVEARGNTQIVAHNPRGCFELYGNARVVTNPATIEEWVEHNGLEITDGKIKLYKAVHKSGEKFLADWDRNFAYKIGEIAEANGFDPDPEDDCSEGIHMATLSWAAAYGRGWKDLALLELEADASEVVVPLYEPGKVRAPKAKVIREVPLEEAGLMGKIIAKQREETERQE